MSSETTILHLSKEVLEDILSYGLLTLQDVNNFRTSCKSLYHLIGSNKLWKKKFLDRWPNVYSNYMGFGEENVDWYEELFANFFIREQLIVKLNGMSKMYFNQNYLEPGDGLEELKELWYSVDNPRVPLIVFDELDRILTDTEDRNLTVKYYARMAFHILNEEYFVEKWEKFASLPKIEQTNEKLAILFAEWNSPSDKSLQLHCEKMLDEITEKARKALKTEYPHHSLFDVPNNIVQQWHKSLVENQFDFKETKQIIDCLCDFLLIDLGFKFMEDSDYFDSVDCPHFYSIDKVLETKQGCEPTMWIVFESVAKRLGVRCELVNSLEDSDFLGWKERYTDHSQIYDYHVIGEMNDKNSWNYDEDKLYPGFPIQVEQILDNLAFRAYDSSRERFSVGLDYEANRRPLFSKFMALLTTNAGLPIKNYYQLEYAEELNFNNMVKKLADMFGLPPEETATHFYDQLQNQSVAAAVMSYRDILEGEMVQQHTNVKFCPGTILYNEHAECYCVVTTSNIGKNHIWYKAIIDGGGIDFYQEEHLRHIDASEMAPVENVRVGKYFMECNGIGYVPNKEFQSSLTEMAEDNVQYKTSQSLAIESRILLDLEEEQ